MPYQAYFNLPEEKRDRIRRAAVKLFATFPYEEVTIRKLVQQAGISRGSLYQYFKSKDEMYVYYIDEMAYMAVTIYPYRRHILTSSSGFGHGNG